MRNAVLRMLAHTLYNTYCHACCCPFRHPSSQLLWAITVVLVWVTANPTLAQDAKTIADGRREFLQYCAVCHGKDGKGNGPMSRYLRMRPADLTQISKKNGGEFPFLETYRFIDGREVLNAQKSRVMPIWGVEFRKEVGGEGSDVEALVQERISKLVYYVQSIQEE